MARTSPSRPAYRALGAASEVVGVLLVGILLQRLVQGGLGLESWKAAEAEMIVAGEADFLRLARLALTDQLIKYGLVLGLAWTLGWYFRGRTPRDHGVKRGERGWSQLLAIGVVLWAVTGILAQALLAAAEWLPALGTGPERWSLFPERWSWSFLLYMAVASFALVPVVEELWARGYMVTRLRDGCDAGGALLVSALFFAFAHGQYFKLEVVSLGLLASLVWTSIAAGAVLLRTGSVFPCVLAHALINLPLPASALVRPAVLGIMVLTLFVARRPLVEWGRWLVTLVRDRTPAPELAIALSTLAAVFVALLISETAAIATGLLLLVASVALSRLERGRLQDT